jgi:hypothetical protein
MSKNVPVSIDVVVERELLFSLDVPLGKNPHTDAFSDDPFGNVAVGVAGMICESTFATAFRCVYVL